MMRLLFMKVVPLVVVLSSCIDVPIDEVVDIGEQIDGLFAKDGLCTAPAAEPDVVRAIASSPPLVVPGEVVGTCSALAVRMQRAPVTIISRAETETFTQGRVESSAVHDDRCFIAISTQAMSRKTVDDPLTPIAPFDATATLCRAELEVPHVVDDAHLPQAPIVLERFELMRDGNPSVSFDTHTLPIVRTASPSNIATCDDSTLNVDVDAFTGEAHLVVSVAERDIPRLTSTQLGMSIRIAMLVIDR